MKVELTLAEARRLFDTVVRARQLPLWAPGRRFRVTANYRHATAITDVEVIVEDRVPRVVIEVDDRDPTD